MMNKGKTLTFIALFAFFVVVAFICGMGINQEQCENLKKENATLENKAEYWKEKYDDMEALHNKDTVNTKKTIYEQTIQYAYIEAWGNVAYKGQFQYLRPKDDYTVYQVMVKSNYSAPDINKVLDEVSHNIILLNAAIEDDFLGEILYIKYLDSDDVPIIEFHFAKKGRKFEMISSTLNSDHIKEFAEALGGN